MPKSVFPQLVDVPKSKGCADIFSAEMKKAPTHIRAEWESRGSHGGTGTSWAGGYDTYEILDERRPDWPTEQAEEWRDKIEWAICEHLNQTKVR